jgi:nitrite reductase/ring-hydroxylating ferredoxin subunit
MPVNKRFLTDTYSAYLNRDVPGDDAELTRVGPGTPCGEYLRRFWQPICFADDLKDVPNRIRILGEDLVVFRDLSGRVGLLQLHCSHRGTSLEFGVIAQSGIRCCYHGWLYDVDGRILETPGEPRNSRLKERFCHGAYPTLEYKGLIFAYMGPPAKRPVFPIFDTYDQPGIHHAPWRHVLPCNWLQVKENCLDLMHNTFLHARVAGPHFTEAFAEFPELEWQYTPDGALCIQTRRVKDNVWVRMNEFIVPNIHQFPPSDDAAKERLFVRALITVWDVPIDDTNTLHIGIMHLREGERPDSPDIDNAANFGMSDNRPYRERQLLPGDYDSQVGQRPIPIHALEILGTTDRGVVMVRKLIRQGIRAVKDGKDPQGWARGTEKVIATHSQNTVLHVAPAATEEADRELLRETGRKILAQH